MDAKAPAPYGDSRLLACLVLVVRERASDLFVLTGAPPAVTRQGAFCPSVSRCSRRRTFALRRAMREAPNVILIGEIRDRATMQHALHYAESGHLCVSTLHAHNANQAVQRILNFFPEPAHKQWQIDLSLNLRAVVAQRLIKGIQGQLVPATEIMLLTPYGADLIQKGQVDELKTAIHRGTEQGMCSFVQSLFKLVESGAISVEEAIAHADNRTDVSLKLRLASGGTLSVDGMSMSAQQEANAPNGR